MPIKATDAEEKQIFRNKLVKPASQDDLIKGTQKTQLVGSDRNPIGTEENPISVEVTNATLTLAEPVTVDGTITEANSTAIKDAVQIIDNFISGSRGLVTEDSAIAIKTAVETIDNFISGSRGLVTEDNSNAIKTAVELIDNAISGSEMQVDVVGALPTGSNTIGSINQTVGQGKTLLFGSIAQGAAGTTVLVAADATKKIKVVSYVFVLNLAGTAKFISGAGDLTGSFTLSTNGGAVVMGQPSSHLFETPVNSALSIVTTLGAANGHFSYFLEA